MPKRYTVQYIIVPSGVLASGSSYHYYSPRSLHDINGYGSGWARVGGNVRVEPESVHQRYQQAGDTIRARNGLVASESGRLSDD